LNRESPLEGRSKDEIYTLVLEEVARQRVVQSWSLTDSLLRRSAIDAQMRADYPDATLEFRSWLSWAFLNTPMSSRPDFAGVRTAILGSLWMIGLTILVAFPLGVGAAIYLEEYAGHSRLNRIIQTNINNLAGVPSIIYGMLGLSIFVRALNLITSGRFVGLANDNGRTILAAALTMALLVLPLIIINAQEAIRAVPNSLRQASLAVGATKWQTIWHHVLPVAFPGILTGNILAMSRAIGETAPLIVVGASTYIVTDPDGPFARFTALPILIYNWTSQPQEEFRRIAAAAIIVLLVMLLSLNSVAVVLRNRFRRNFS
jgi:phosphate transport system permease protein